MISGEAVLFAATVVCGFAAGLLFDFMRAIRLELQPNAVIVGITDVLFCIVSTGAFVFCIWKFGNGGLRLFELLGVILGAVFYFLLISRWILALFCKIIRFILKILLTPRRFLYKILIVSKFKAREKRSHDRGI